MDGVVCLCGFFELLDCILVWDVHPVLYFPRLGITVVLLQVEVSEDLPHELAFFIEDIIELGLITSVEERINWNSELSNNLVGEPTEHLRFLIDQRYLHV